MNFLTDKAHRILQKHRQHVHRRSRMFIVLDVCVIAFSIWLSWWLVRNAFIDVDPAILASAPGLYGIHIQATAFLLIWLWFQLRIAINYGGIDRYIQVGILAADVVIEQLYILSLDSPAETGYVLLFIVLLPLCTQAIRWVFRS